MRPDYSFLPGGDPNKVKKEIKPEIPLPTPANDLKHESKVEAPAEDENSFDQAEGPATPEPKAPTPKASVPTITVSAASRPVDSQVENVSAPAVASSIKSDAFKPDVQVSFTDSLSKTTAAERDEAAKPSSGVVTDMSDLDVWGPEKAAGKPRTVQIEKEAGQKTVSLIGLEGASGSTTEAAQAPANAAGDEEQLQMAIQITN